MNGGLDNSLVCCKVGVWTAACVMLEVRVRVRIRVRVGLEIEM